MLNNYVVYRAAEGQTREANKNQRGIAKIEKQ